MSIIQRCLTLPNRLLRKILKKRFDPAPEVAKNISLICSLFDESQRDTVERDLSEFRWEGSWHYILFKVLLSHRRGKSQLEFLEIGTYDGAFIRYLAEHFDGNFWTVDLEDDDPIFKATYNRSDISDRNDFILQRRANLKKDNIKFIQMDSFFLINEFTPKRFDFIWVDGDHLNPQVSFDIFAAFHLLKRDGVFCVDDVFLEPMSKKYSSNESFITLESMRSRGLINLSFILKRVKYTNKFKAHRKYIAVVTLN